MKIPIMGSPASLKMLSVPSIEVCEVSKCFEIYDSHGKRVRQALVNMLPFKLRKHLQNQPFFKEYWALKNINLILKRGEAVAIVGRNGSGKSTLLQIIASTMTATAGCVKIKGRVTALLELGSGFNPSFTGRENVILNAQILGLTRAQALQKFDEISEFAELGDFINQPVLTYSSGMVMRLGFAVQTVMEPDILIVDEALAVGDAKFQDKCYRKLRELRGKGTSILFVSHDMNAVTSFCDRAVVLDQGKLVFEGAPYDAAKQYMSLLYSESNPPELNRIVSNHNANYQNIAQPESPHARTKYSQDRFGNGALEIEEVWACDDNGKRNQVFMTGAKCWINQIVFAKTIITHLSTGFIIRNSRGLELFGITSDTAKCTVPEINKGQRLKISIQCRLNLAAGEYFIQAANADQKGVQYDCQFEALQLTVLGTPQLFTNSIVNLEPKFNVELIKKLEQ